MMAVNQEPCRTWEQTNLDAALGAPSEAGDTE